MTTDWTPPGWEIEVEGAESNGWRIVKLECRADGCGHTAFTGIPPGVGLDQILESSPFRDHQAQHRPGRARDIGVDWIVSACCNVCEDQIGRIEDQSEILECMECGTTWDRDGTDGETSEENER